MTEENILTKEIAEQFLEDEDSVDEAEFEAIEDAAAESVSKCAGGLSLDGLTQLSDAAAESLSKLEGALYLNGLASLSDAAAKALSMHEGNMYFESLRFLSPTAEKHLKQRDGEIKLGWDAVTYDFNSMAEVVAYFSDVDLLTTD